MTVYKRVRQSQEIERINAKLKIIVLRKHYNMLLQSLRR